MKINLTFSELSPAEAAALLAVGHGPASHVGTPPAIAPAVAPPRPAAAPPAPMGSPPLAAPPPAVAAPVAPPPAAAPPPMAQPPATPGAVTHQAVLAAMQSYARIYKTAGVKAVLQQIGTAKVQDVTDQAQLKWLLDTFNAGLTKQS